MPGSGGHGGLKPNKMSFQVTSEKRGEEPIRHPILRLQLHLKGRRGRLSVLIRREAPGSGVSKKVSLDERGFEKAWCGLPCFRDQVQFAGENVAGCPEVRNDPVRLPPDADDPKARRKEIGPVLVVGQHGASDVGRAGKLDACADLRKPLRENFDIQSKGRSGRFRGRAE